MVANPETIALNQRLMKLKDTLRAAAAKYDLAIALWEELKEPRTVRELTELLGLKKYQVWAYLRRLQVAGRVQPVGTVKDKNHLLFKWKRVEKGPIGPWSTSSNPSSEVSHYAPAATTSAEEKRAELEHTR